MSKLKKTSCPCTHGFPCAEDCSCIRPYSSKGCSRCCRYGSDEQKKQQSEIINNIFKLAKNYEKGK